MWLRVATIISLALLFIASGCAATEVRAEVAASDRPREMSPDVSDSDLSAVVDGDSRFAWDLYHELAGREDTGNLFFSPHSISVALAMTWAGARGVTEREMADTLHFTLPQDQLHPAFNALDLALRSRGLGLEGSEEGPIELNTANSLWGRIGYSFLPDFLDTLAINYGAGMRLVDFAGDPEGCRATINDWVEDETSDMIIDLIPSGLINPSVFLVLVNAIYFKADWLSMFDPENTYDAPFTLPDESTVTVRLMHQQGDFMTSSGDGFQALELPYSGDELSMLIILPDEGRFEEIEGFLSNEWVSEVAANLYEEDIVVEIPRFHLESSFLLGEVLSEMGMPSAFGAGADFSGMDGTGGLFIGEVVHKAVVEVTEEGTEAAAATGVVMFRGGMPPSFRADRPFIFAIRDRETGAALFAGRVVDPSTQ